MQRIILPTFEGRENVICVTSDKGVKAYLTKDIPFKEEATKLGGCKLNTIETDTKHVLFVFNQEDKEVKRYFLGKKLRGKTPKELVEIMDSIAAFEAFNPKTKEWVPCVGMINKRQEEVNHEEKTQEKIEKHAYSSVSYYQRFGDCYPKESREREREEEEYGNYREYGTNDPRKIEKIKKEKKKEEKSSCVVVIILFVLVFLLPAFIMGVIQKCTGSKFNPLEDDHTPWTPRHTQIQKPMQNNVNAFIFTLS